jgi:ubiquinone/menaquinone biosynthesis C-methylase UbiE
MSVPTDLPVRNTDRPDSPACIDPFVQQWVAATNGNLYIPLINKLTRYPIPRWPGKNSLPRGGLLLDIGCGWGRWMIAAGRAGYRPVGIDVRLEPLQAARRLMQAQGLQCHVVVADLSALPFRSGSFDYVFSYSVIQHAHKRKAASCIADVSRVLKKEATCLIELPLKYGLTNVRHLRKSVHEQTGFDSWVVRYYTWNELKQLFGRVFGSCQISCDCFCGIGVRPEDIDLLPWKYKPVVIASTALKAIARAIPLFIRLSDSVFIECHKTVPGARGDDRFQ